MICFAEAALDAEVRKWSWMGINKDTYTRTLSGGTYKWLYDVEHVGFKYNGNAIMAAMALVGLKYLEEDNVYRRRLCEVYDRDLEGAAGVGRVPIAPGCTPSRHLYQVLVEDRDEVMVGLNAAGIYPGVHYRDNTLYRMYAAGEGTCPRARAASERLISLPLHLRMGEEDARRVARRLQAAASGGTAVRQ
jgi:dTDP-4-amino-4,6-dideoxygalactose transaminase